MDPLTVAERIVAQLKNLRLPDGPHAASAVAALEALVGRQGPLPLKANLISDLTNLARFLPTEGDNVDLIEDLHIMADWLERDGFIPFVELETGVAPR